jgi:hypothetical protein
VRGFAHAAQQPSIALVAHTHTTHALPFLQHCLQVVQHEERTLLTQVLEQETQTSFEACRHEAQGLGGKHLEALIQQRFTGRGIAQGTPDHRLEVGSNLVHQTDRER